MKDIIFEKISIKAFGCLKDTVITPTAGINLINARNGAGKSTLAAFIKFIFYGFSGTRLQGILGNEKNMYIPWDSNFVEGSIEFSCPRGRFCVERYFCKPSKETVTVTELSGGKKVLGGIVPGEYFFGVSEETYTKTAFFYSLKRTKNGDPILAQQLENLVFSADEMMSYSKASEKINAARTEIVNRQNRGRLPSAEAALVSAQNDLYTATQLNDEIVHYTLSLNSKKELIDKRKKEQDELGKELKNIEKYEAKKKLEEYYALKNEVEQAQQKLEAVKARFGGSIPGSSFVEMLSTDNEKLTAEREKLEEERAACAELQAELDKFRERNTFAAHGAVYSKTEPLLALRTKVRNVSLTVFIFFAFAFGALAGAFYGLKLDIPPAISYTVAGLCVLSLILLIVFAIRLRAFASRYGYKSVKRFRLELKDYPEYEISVREKQSYIDRLSETIQTHADECYELSESVGNRIGSLTGERPEEADYPRCITALLSDVSAGALIKNDYEKKHDIYDYNYSGVDIEALESDAEGASIPARSAESVRRDMEILNGIIDDLGKQCTDIKTQIALRKTRPHEPSKLEAQCEVLHKQIDGLKMRKDAYDLAYEYLEKASTYMRSTISPQLTQYATEYFCVASGYDYSALGVDTNLNVTFDSDSHTRSADYLSDGTRDTAYLCLRLALIKMIYRQGKVPAVLDDAFGHLDPKRLALMLSVLASAYEDGQVFIFTCRCDEQILLEQLGKPPHMLSLS